MGYQVVSKQIAVPNREKGEEEIFVRGQMLPDWVGEYELFVMTSSGYIKPVVDPDPVLTEAEKTPEPVRLPEHPPPPRTEADLRAGRQAEAARKTAEDAKEEERIRAQAEGRPPLGGSEAKRPADYASKAEWVDFAVSKGANRDEAESSSKADLVSKYGK
jgi:hypothetical protein